MNDTKKEVVKEIKKDKVIKLKKGRMACTVNSVEEKERALAQGWELDK